MSGRAAAVVLAALAAACSSARIVGGAVVAPGARMPATVLGTWTTANCRDPFQRPLDFPKVTVRLGRGTNDILGVVESRDGYDDIIVLNVFRPEHEPSEPRPTTMVFQVSVEPRDGPRILREYRVPETGSGPGRFAIVTDVLDWGSERDDETPLFRATYRVPSIACDLSPVSS